MTARDTTPRLRTVASIVLSVASVGGCERRPDIRYETEHLRVATDFEAPLCRGDLDHMELVITTVEAELATDLDKPIDVYLWAYEDWPPQRDWCMTGRDSSCFTGKAIYANLPALDHELVHAVVSMLGDPAPFWSEGSAEALQSSRVLFALDEPVANIDLDRDELSYRTAGSFTRWVFETYGEERFRELLRAKQGARKAFEETYEMSVEAAQAQYFAEAPYSYAPLVACEHPDLPLVGDLRWSEAVDLDCAESGIYGGPYGIGTYRVLNIVARGYYAISTLAPIGLIGRCADEDLPLSTELGDPDYGDLPPVTSAFPGQYVRSLTAEESTILELAPGRYELSVAYPDHERRTTQLDVWAVEGGNP